MSEASHSRGARLAEQIPVLVVSSIYFLILANYRFVAADEGFYLTAARLVMEGKLPYIDFFYPQMPLLPYVYGLWLSLFDMTWISARVFAALVSALISLLVYKRIRFLRGTPAAWFGVFLFCASSLVLGWFPIAKAYSLSVLFLFAAYYVVSLPEASVSRLPHVLAGICIGCAVNVRLYFAALIPILLVLIWRDSRESRLSSSLAFLFGGALTTLPLLYFVAQDFDVFWFNNLGFHENRSSLASAVLWKEKLDIFRALWGLDQTPKFTGYQNCILLCLTCLYPIFSRLNRSSVDGAWYLGLVLFFVNFIPSPAWFQYFSATIPFFVICAVLALSYIAEAVWDRSSVGKLCVLLLVGSLTVEYVRDSVYDIYHYTVSGEGVQNVRKSNRNDWRIETLQTVSDRIDALSDPGDVVFAQWPGHLFETHAAYVSGLENQFWMRVTSKLSKKEHIRYKLMSNKRKEKALADPEVKLVVVHQEKIGRYFPGDLLGKNGFKLVDKVHRTHIYQRADVK